MPLPVTITPDNAYQAARAAVRAMKAANLLPAGPKAERLTLEALEPALYDLTGLTAAAVDSLNEHIRLGTDEALAELLGDEAPQLARAQAVALRAASAQLRGVTPQSD